MARLKCKMCGGDLQLIEGSTICECEYCGSRQTIPVADNEKKMNLFVRANRLRFNCEFDKAAGIYESIVGEFPEEPEAYWGLLLCKYGIEYVDDPATGKKIPTCHRSSFESVMEDENLELATEYADLLAKRLYREEAKQIEELRKGIIEVSSTEEPYDIFICYKETDENGDRTLDSVIAQDIYNELTEKGYRVFFSRITLEDKLGQEYEPYIFAALHSAKIMLAVGTKYEYYDAVWVKNEWSRFLQLIAAGEKKTLIPCYKNLDAYDMPKEFARLQAQDMGKVGAMQDLVRGIEKILQKKGSVESEKTDGALMNRAPSLSPSGPNITALLQRGEIALEDGEWDKAAKFYDQILDMDAQNAEAYLGLAMAEGQCKDRESFEELYSKAYSVLNNGKNIIRVRKFGTPELNSWLDRLDNVRKQRTEEAKQEELDVREKEYLKAVQAKKDEEDRLKRLKDAAVSVKENGVMIKPAGGYIVALKSDGTVIVGNNTYVQEIVQKWRNIASISMMILPCEGSVVSEWEWNVFGIRFDGTVVSTAEGQGYSRFSRSDPSHWSHWNNITALAAGHNHIVGLQRNGTVVATGDNKNRQCDVTCWTDIIAIGAEYDITVGLKKDGTVLCAGSTEFYGNKDLSAWTGIRKISVWAGVIGMKFDGTVVAAGLNDCGQCNVESWHDVSQVRSGIRYTIGLKTDGTLFATGLNDHGQCSVETWTDITAIATGLYHTAGLRSDGTVVATGKNDQGQCDVGGWKNVIAIGADPMSTVGITIDGTVLVAGSLNRDYKHLTDWKLFESPETIRQERQEAIERCEKEGNSTLVLEQDHLRAIEQINQKKQLENERLVRNRLLFDERENLTHKLKNLKGLFVETRKKEILKRLEEIEEQLSGLNESGNG